MAKKFIGEAEKAKYIQEFREALMECGGATGLFYMVDTAQGLCAGLKVQGLGTLGNYIMEVLGRSGEMADPDDFRSLCEVLAENIAELPQRVREMKAGEQVDKSKLS